MKLPDVWNKPKDKVVRHLKDRAPFKLDKRDDGKRGMDGPVGSTLNGTSDDLASVDPTSRTTGEMAAEAEAKRLAEEAAGTYDNVVIPGASTKYDLPKELEFKKLTQEGYTPTQATAAVQGDSKFNDIAVDPKYVESQMSALSGMQDIVDSGGMTAADEANLSRVQSDVGRADRGRREAIQDRMRRTGMGGSGLDLMQQMQSGQAATDRASQAGLDVAGQASNRHQQGIRDLGTMSTGMRSQDFNEQAQVAAASDSIALFNAQVQQQTDLFNAGAGTEAARYSADANNKASTFNTQGANNTDQFNLQNRQEVTEANTDMGNNDAQRDFDNTMSLGSAKSNAKLGHANTHQNTADRHAKTRGATTQGVVTAAGAGLQYSDEDLKTDIEPISSNEIDEFLSAIQPKKFKYKNSANGEGDRVGVMAQDIEPTAMGSSIVQDTPEGKVLDNNNLLGALLDSVAHLNKKQKEQEDFNLPQMITGDY